MTTSGGRDPAKMGLSCMQKSCNNQQKGTPYDLLPGCSAALSKHNMRRNRLGNSEARSAVMPQGMS